MFRVYRSGFSAFYNHPSSFRARSVFLLLLFRDLILREHVSSLQDKAISRYRSIYSRDGSPIRRKVITFQIPSSFRESPSFPSVLSTYRNLDYTVYCCFVAFFFFSFSLSMISIFVSHFACLRRARITWQNWRSLDCRCVIDFGTSAVYNLALFSMLVIFEIEENKRRGKPCPVTRVLHMRGFSSSRFISSSACPRQN